MSQLLSIRSLPKRPPAVFLSKGTAKKFYGKRYSRSGFSLVEVVLSMALLTLLGAGIVASTLQIRRAAESTVRESLAVAVGTGFLEQLISAEYPILRNHADSGSSWRFFTRDGTEESILLRSIGTTGNGTRIDIPLVTELKSDGSGGTGNSETTMGLWVLPMIDRAPGNGENALHINIRLTWDSPNGGQTTRSLAYVRSRVPK